MKSFAKKADILVAYEGFYRLKDTVTIMAMPNEPYAYVYIEQYEDSQNEFHGPFFCEESEEIVLLLIQKTYSR